MKLPDLQAALVDLDGTMIDTLGDFLVSLNRMLDDLALPGIARDDIERYIGKGSDYLIRSTLAHVGADPQRFEQAYARYQFHYLAINGDHAPVYPGVVEGLEMLAARGLKLGCLTNKPTLFAKPLLAKKGLDRFFSVMFGGDAFERRKPDPMPLQRTCEALGVAPAHSLMLGDSSNDALAARAAGCPVVLVTYGYNHGQPIRLVDADGFVDRLDDLAALLH